MRALGLAPSKEEARRLSARYDQDGSNTIDFEEYLQLMKARFAEIEAGAADPSVPRGTDAPKAANAEGAAGAAGAAGAVGAAEAEVVTKEKEVRAQLACTHEATMMTLTLVLALR